MSNRYGFTNGDYYIGQIKDEETCYVIGTNNNVLFIAEETLILPTVDCWIKINDDEVWQKIHGEDYFEYHRRVLKVSFRKASKDGYIEIWAEGTAKQ